MSNEIMSNDFLNDLKNILATQNQTILSKVGDVSRQVDTLAEEQTKMKKDINFMKNERPIDRRESGRIKRAISRRVCELLDVPLKKEDRTVEQRVRYEKYSRKLFGRCYTEIPNEGNLARPSYLDTPKGRYDSAMKRKSRMIFLI